MSGVAFQHHVQIPPACHAVIRAVRIYAHFRQVSFTRLSGNHDMSAQWPLVFPPATEGEGLSGFVSIYVKSEGKLGPDLRLYAQQFQYMGVGSSLGSVPSCGKEPSTGSQYIQWASLASAKLTST